MKRHVQQIGVRQWAGDDLIELQNEPLTVLDNFFQQYDQLIVSGCTIVNDQIGEGLIGLWGFDPNNKPVYKVAPLAKHSGVKFPVYAYLKCTVETRQYGDGNTKPVKEVYTAELSETPPTNNTPYLTIYKSGNKRFNEAIQDSEHKFLTDTEKTKLSGIANNANNYAHPTHTTAATGLYKIEVDSFGHVKNTVTATKNDIGLAKVDNTADNEKSVKHAQTVEKVTETALKNGLGFVPYRTAAYFEQDGKLAQYKEIQLSQYDTNFSIRVGNSSINGVTHYGIFLIHPSKSMYTLFCSYTINLPNKIPLIEVDNIFTWSSGITPLYSLTVEEFEKYKYMGFEIFIQLPHIYFTGKIKGYYNPTGVGNYFELSVFDE